MKCGYERKIIFLIFHTLSFFFLYIFGYICEAFPEPEVRGLWVVSDMITTPQKVKNLVVFADTHHYNVLFVQVRRRGDAYYKSYFVPGPENDTSLPDTFDPLREVIRLSHAKGIEVHAWFNMYFTWSLKTKPTNPEHPLNKHPEWFMVSVTGNNMADCDIDSIQNGGVEGRYMSPGHEEVRSYLSRVITEVIVTYNVDGIHMDYVRYPGRDYDFHPKICQDFFERYGVDPREVVSGKSAIDSTLEYLGKWVDYRTDQIDKQVRSIRRRINLVDKNIRLSAAVKAHADEAYYQYGQNWIGWLTEGIVDFVVTMSYYPDTEQFFTVMSESLQKADKRKIIAGIGIYKLTPKKTAEQIALVHDMNLLGYCFFSYTTLLENPQFSPSLDALVTSTDIELPYEFKPYLRMYHD